MASQAGGACCVCNKSTVQRCGACSEAGFDLFFCSREHQKLVYFAHKQVCCKNAKPFSFPPFSPDEVATLQSFCTSEMLDGAVRAKLDTLVADSPVEGLKAEDLFLLSLTLLSEGSFDPATSLIADPTTVFCTCRRAIWTELAKAARQREGTEDKPSYSMLLKLFLPALRVSTFACYLGDLYTKDLSNHTFFPVNEDWYIRLMHHTFVFSALLYRVSSDIAAGEPYPTDLDPLLLAAAAPLCDILDEMKEQDEKLGQALGEAFAVLTEGSKVKIVFGGTKQ